MVKQDRGFRSMDPEKRRRIASKAGKAAHAKGRAHEWSAEEAREAGRKGGSASHRHHDMSPTAQAESRPGTLSPTEAK